MNRQQGQYQGRKRSVGQSGRGGQAAPTGQSRSNNRNIQRGTSGTRTARTSDEVRRQARTPSRSPYGASRGVGQPRQIPSARRRGGTVKYPAYRSRGAVYVPLIRKKWFRLWMAAIVLIAVAAIVAVAVRSHSSKNDQRNISLAAEIDTSQAADTEAVGNDAVSAGIYSAYADESTADMTNDIDSGYGVLIDVSEGRIVASKGAFAKINPASMTKLMTLIVAYENIDELDGYFEMTSAIIDPVYTAGASLAGFSPGEKVLIRDLFYGAALPSGADATSALAICAAGDEDSFVQLMNKKVKELGLTGTHFENASGLQGDDHYSTCYDMAMILKYAMDNEFLREVISTYQYTTSPTEKHPEGLELESTMLARVNGDEAEGFTIIGGKTGYTPNAGYCLASFGERSDDGAQFILVTAKGTSIYGPIFDAIEVYGKYAVTSKGEADETAEAD